MAGPRKVIVSEGLTLPSKTVGSRSWVIGLRYASFRW